ncbi:MAG: ribosome biogenesis GTPase Der [candidate division Zixibacteria bacterium HGW-Zixibacteria-1]|nr:MAG: ribosome biogenesis GTPase Der [candidate division Zixibacteria bacterium HGW-Zixibacteria-1]
MSIPLVALIGRPNVGKSSLFNRFLRKRLAIVDDTPGVTRDRNYSLCDWAGREFYLIDTGGMIPNTKTGISRLVLEQSETAIDQADLIVFIVDSRTGPDEVDERIAAKLQKSGKKVLLVANKADNDIQEYERFQFLRLGLGEPMAISATVGRNIGETLDLIVEMLPSVENEKDESEAVRIAVIGKPNVGKSMLINRLIGEERVIVSPIPGTTRDAVDTPFELDGKKYVLIDTAGLRKKAKVKEDIEYFTTLRTLKAIESCHVAMVLVDASQGLTVQDLKVIEDAVEARRAIVMVVNKWDLIEKDERTADIFTTQIREFAKTISYLPIIYISALTGQRVLKTISLVDHVYENWHIEIATPELNNFLEELTQKQPPAAVQGKYIKLFYVTQSGVRPPTFMFFCNYPDLLQKSYLRFIENQFRARYDFEGIPVRFVFKKRK